MKLLEKSVLAEISGGSQFEVNGVPVDLVNLAPGTVVNNDDKMAEEWLKKNAGNFTVTKICLG